jgi:hypothetical protein
MFLRGPAVRQRAGKHGDGEIGWCTAVGNGFDDSRRHEGERGEVSNFASALSGLYGYALQPLGSIASVS